MINSGLPLKLVIAADDYLVRTGLRHGIDWNQHGYTICASASDSFETIHALKEHNADMVIMDFSDMSGFEFITHAKKIVRSCKLVVLSRNPLRQDVILSGADEYLLSPFNKEQLIATVIRVGDRIKNERSKALTQLFAHDDKAQSGRLDDRIVLSVHNESGAAKCVASILSYIERHFYEDITIKDIADALHYNALYLGRLFKASTGKTFSAYLKQLRINNAMELLVTTDYNISSIAYMVGFRDADYFCRQFSKQTNCRANEYRKKHSLGKSS